MLTVTADASWPSSPGEVWAALGRRESYLCFPGLSPAPRPSDSAVSGLSPAPRTINRVVSGLPPARRTRAAETSRPRGAVLHELDLPIVDRREQIATLTVGRAGARRPHGANTRGGDARGRNRRGAARRFSVRGPLVSIAGCWQLEPAEGGVRARLTLRYDIAEPLRTEAVNTLRSRSPLPIRTDADAILHRAVDEFFETRFAEHAAAFCERLRERLDRPAAGTGTTGKTVVKASRPPSPAVSARRGARGARA